MSTVVFEDALVRPGTEHDDSGVLAVHSGKQYLMRERAALLMHASAATGNSFLDAVSTSQDRRSADPLVRLPSLKDSKWKVNVLQRWVGRVESISADFFNAVIYDLSCPQNPPEEVELPGEEISPSDLKLLVEGATFYWAIGYRETPGGQRERVSTLRFARQPRLGGSLRTRVVQRAKQSADLLQSD